MKTGAQDVLSRNEPNDEQIKARSRRPCRNFFPYLATLILASAVSWSPVAANPQPLHEVIDAHLESAHAGAPAALTTDEEFLRRVTLDLTGLIPSTAEVRSFLADQNPNKRDTTIARLLAGPQHVRHLQIRFDIMLMERRNAKQIKNPEWQKYLFSSFRSRKPYNQLAAEVLRADQSTGPLRAATKFYLDRDGEVTVLTRDVGRLFFGLDLECAQCHDHPSIDDYRQEHYYELFAFLNRSYPLEEKKTSLQLMAERAEGEANFKSVFTEIEGQSQPRLPSGEMELIDPKFRAGLYKRRPGEGMPGVPTYSRRTRLAAATGSGNNEAFARNIANRLWAFMLGHGLVHPPDLHHSDNPATHPALLADLAEALVAMNYDVSRFLGEIARSRAYQRTSATAQTQADVQAATDLLKAREKSSEARRAELQKAREAWANGNAALADAADALDATEFANATAAAEHARDEAYQATSALIQKQKLIIEKETALRLARQAAKLTDGAVTHVGKFEPLRKTANDLREKAESLAGEIEKDREALPELEEKVRATEAALPEAHTHAATVTIETRPLVARAEEKKHAVAKLKRAFQKAKRKLEQSEYALEENQLFVRVHELSAKQVAAHKSFAPVAEKHNALQESATKLSEELRKAADAIAGARKETGESKTTAAKTKTELMPKKEAAKLLAKAEQQVFAALEKLPDDKELKAALAALEKEGQTAKQDAQELEKALTDATAKLKKAKETIASSEEVVKKTTTAQKENHAQLASIAANYAALKEASEAAANAALEAHDELIAVWRRRFAIASLKALSPEQLGWSALRALGYFDERLRQELESNKKNDTIQVAFDAERATHNNLQGKVNAFVRLYGGPPGSDEREFQATAQQALFMMNSNEIHDLLKPADGLLAARLSRLAPPQLAEDLYLSVLSRLPTKEEVEVVAAYLKPEAPGEGEGAAPDPVAVKAAAIQDLIWALLTSGEFRFNR